jgi:hypothetical protein
LDIKRSEKRKTKAIAEVPKKRKRPNAPRGFERNKTCDKVKEKLKVINKEIG